MKTISNIFSLFIIVALLIIWMQGEPREQVSLDLSEDDLWLLANGIKLT